MCKCTPNMRTPFCGGAGCEWPASTSTSTVPRPPVDPSALLSEMARVLSSALPVPVQPLKIHPLDYLELAAHYSVRATAVESLPEWCGWPVIVDPKAPRLPRKSEGS